MKTVKKVFASGGPLVKSVRSYRRDGQPGGLLRQDLKQWNVAVKTGRLATLACKYHFIVVFFLFSVANVLTYTRVQKTNSVANVFTRACVAQTMDMRSPIWVPQHFHPFSVNPNSFIWRHPTSSNSLYLWWHKYPCSIPIVT